LSAIASKTMTRRRAGLSAPATRTVEAGSAHVRSDLQFPAEATRVSPHKAAARQEVDRQLGGSSNIQVRQRADECADDGAAVARWQ
jgi:hypothetical protein